MDPCQYTNLLVALAQVPDPRKARGKQHEWRIVLAVLCAAVASGQRSVRAIAQWANEHEAELIQHLQPPRQRLPSAATLYRVLRRVDVASVEEHLTRFSYSQEQEYEEFAKAKHKAQDKRTREKRQRRVEQLVG